MIKTHQPRGHHWTCVSHFQQSKQYRNLDAESGESRSGKTLVTDSNDGASGSSRAAKRRRIETLANGFLDGKPLFISSASSNGQDLTKSVESVLHERRLGWDEVLDDHDDNLWADGQDGWELLRERSKRLMASKPLQDRSKDAPRETKTGRTHLSPIDGSPEPAGLIEGQSRPTVSIAPSEDALARAAELRARKGSANVKIAGLPGKLLDVSKPATQSAPPTVKAQSFKQCSSSRPLNPHTPTDTTMADELRLSRTESPSHRPRALTVPPMSFGSDTTVEYRSSGGDGDTTLQPLQYDGHLVPTSSAQPINTGSTAMDICTAEQNRRSPPHQAHAAWTPINRQRTNRDATNTGSSNHSIENGDVAANQQSTVDAVTDTVTKSSNMQSAKITSKVSTRRSTKSTSQRHNTPSQKSRGDNSQTSSQLQLTQSFNASKMKATLPGKPPNGSTPFVYRKKVKLAKNETSVPAETSSGQQCGGNDYQASEAAGMTPKPSEPTTILSVSAAPPTLDMSFQHDSSFAPKLNMALADDYMNKRRSQSPSSTHRSSSKKAIRSSTRLSGESFARSPSKDSSHAPRKEVAVLSQQNDSKTVASVDGDSTLRPARRSSVQWPGTQVLLNQAQYDLFMSPEKLMSTFAVTGSELHDDHNANVSLVQASENVRRSPQKVSQEYLPGTQALMDNWSPWSTAKKPKTRTNLMQSPSTSKNNVTPAAVAKRSLRSSTKRPHSFERVCETEPRNTSLRFATSTFETPMPMQQSKTAKSTTSPTSAIPYSNKTTRSTGHTAPTPSNDNENTNNEINLDLSNFSFAATDAPTFADVDDSMIDWSSHDKVSSFQHVQLPNAVEDPSQTLANLATEFLSTADVDGILGRL